MSASSFSRPLTCGFHSKNIPLGFGFQTHACSS